MYLFMSCCTDILYLSVQVLLNQLGVLVQLWICYSGVISSPELKAHRGACRILMVRRPAICPAIRPSTMLKDVLLKNRLANQSQILCEASLGRGKESLFTASGLHDQDSHHAHIW